MSSIQRLLDDLVMGIKNSAENRLGRTTSPEHLCTPTVWDACVLGMRHHTHTAPLEAVGVNLIFLNTFYAGESYTEREHHAWLSAAGFVDITRAPFLLCDGFGSGLITARKRE
jgi:hypothetical protein